MEDEQRKDHEVSRSRGMEEWRRLSAGRLLLSPPPVARIVNDNESCIR